MLEKMYLAALQAVPGIGSARIKALVNCFGSARQAWQADQGDLISANLDSKVCAEMLRCRQQLNPEILAANCQRQRISICTITEPEYPELLRNTFNPPYVLYYRGHLPASAQLIAVVGARRASAYGKNAATGIAAELARAGIGIVSGAARGIDTAAHQGALQAAGYTLAVLGSGVDICYPPENAKLLASIAEQGAVVSEYTPGTTARPGHFPARNRIISGLAQGVVVVEAAERSGALITADFALEEGRDVFAVPGSIFAAGSKGVHKLIKMGAKLLDSAKDVLEEYGWQQPEHTDTDIVLSPEETLIFATLSCDEPRTVEEIIIAAGLPPAKVSYLLLQLELRGLTMEDGCKRYLRAARRDTR